MDMGDEGGTEQTLNIGDCVGEVRVALQKMFDSRIGSKRHTVKIKR